MFKKDFDYYAQLIKNGKIVAFPTETVYGLAASVYDEKAILSLYKLKNRSILKSLTLHFSNLSLLKTFAKNIPQSFYDLYSKFLPGPITILLYKNDNIPKWISSNNLIGVRFPSNSIAKKFIDKCGGVVAATSANKSNEAPLYDYSEVKKQFKNIEIIKGDCFFKKASSIIDLTNKDNFLVRQGVIKFDK